MFKKFFISLLIILLFYSTTISEYEKAEAAAVAEQGAVVFGGFLTAVGAAATAGMHLQDQVAEQVDTLKEWSVEAWNEFSPEMKQAFNDSITAAGDRIIIAGDWIDSLLYSMSESETLTSGTTGLTYDSGTFYAPDGKLFRYTVNGNTVERKTIVFVPSTYTYYEQSYLLLRIGGTEVGRIYAKDRINPDSEYEGVNGRDIHEKYVNQYAKRRFSNLYDNPSLAKLRSVGSSFGFSLTLVNDDGSVYSDNSIYNRVDNWFRDRDALNNGLSLGIPRTRAYTPDGKLLDLDVAGAGGLTLDGVPYTGEIDWQVETEAGMLLPHLDYELDGNPVYNVDGTLVGSDGLVIPTDTVPNVTVDVPDVIYVDGVPYIRTATGDLINILTGEIVITGGEVPPVSGEFENPKKALDFTPLIMVGNTLKEKFPFSLPWDFLKQLGIFNVQPESPKFKIGIDNYLEIGGHTIPMNFDLDLSMFDKVAAIVRWFTRIIWIIGLIFILRKLLPE